MAPAARWCVGRWPAAGEDGLTWQEELRAHAAGEFSMAAAQANEEMEDQGQFMASPDATLVGVYDGHGGPDASRFLRSRLFPLVHGLASERGGAVTAEVIRKAFMAADEEYLRMVRRSLPNMPRAAAAGSCCLLGAISGDTLYVANAGDSRAVLGRRATFRGGGPPVVAERLSAEHNVASEEARRELAALHPDDDEIVVHARGAWRVKGIIQVSRSIGDVYLKTPEFRQEPAVQRLCSGALELTRPVLSAEPSIHARKLKPGDLFVVFASDGLWEHLSDEAAVQLVSKSPRRGVAGRLVQAALKEAARKREVRRGDMRRIEPGVRRHFHDDITAVVVFLDLDGRRARRRGKVVDSSYSSCSNTPLDVYSFNNSGA